MHLSLLETKLLWIQCNEFYPPSLGIYLFKIPLPVPQNITACSILHCIRAERSPSEDYFCYIIIILLRLLTSVSELLRKISEFPVTMIKGLTGCWIFHVILSIEEPEHSQVLFKPPRCSHRFLLKECVMCKWHQLKSSDIAMAKTKPVRRKAAKGTVTQVATSPLLNKTLADNDR